MTKLKFASSRGPPVQIVGLSATLPNIKLLTEWVGADLFVTTFRPVPLEQYVKVGATVFRDDCCTAVAKLRPTSSEDSDHVVTLCNETISGGAACCCAHTHSGCNHRLMLTLLLDSNAISAAGSRETLSLSRPACLRHVDRALAPFLLLLLQVTACFASALQSAPVRRAQR